MFASRRLASLAIITFAALALAACQEGASSNSEFEWQPVFGDQGNDISPVIARVAGVEITEEDLDLRFDELPPKLQRRYDGEEGRLLLLKNMVEQVLMVRGAIDLEIYNQREVARTIISQRRSTLDQAMRRFGIHDRGEPTIEQLQAHFMSNRDRYRVAGRVLARHVETLNRADADRAYERLESGTHGNQFPYVVADLSINEQTKELDGSLGWFIKGGFVPNVLNSNLISTLFYDLPDGLNPPLRVGDHWHVVEIVRREQPRPQTFNEARDQVAQEYLPLFREQQLAEYLASARLKYPAELMGKYAPGRGVSDRSLFERAVLITDPEMRLDVLLLIVDDYPESEFADDALYLAAHATMDRWGDQRQTTLYLTRLIEEYPDSEMVEDARYLLENMGNPNAWAPKSIEDLRK